MESWKNFCLAKEKVQNAVDEVGEKILYMGGLYDIRIGVYVDGVFIKIGS